MATRSRGCLRDRWPMGSASRSGSGTRPARPATSSPAAWPTLPGVPAIAESIPGFDVRSWTGLVTTKGTPPAVIERLNREVRRALALPALKQRLEEMGNEVRAGSPDELGQRIVADIARWTELIRAAHVPQQ